MSGSSQGASGSHKATVLVVDDEILIRWVLADHLQECGYKVLLAPDADAAIQAIQEYHGPVDIVVTDVRMPGAIDGLGLAEWIRANRPEIGVIVASGHTTAEDISKELCNHIVEIVRKPYDYADLSKRIEEWLAQQPKPLPPPAGKVPR